MVLQNKFKARASRRYNAARGGTGDGRGRGGRGRGGGQRRFDETSFPTLPGQEASVEGEGDENDEEEEEARQERAKYAPRKLTSNAWRFETEQETDADGKPVQGGNGDGEEEEQEEPEVDLSGLMERVAKLDSSRTSKAVSSEQAARLALDADAADVDVSLLHLLDRQREREAEAAGVAEDDVLRSLPRHALSAEQRAELEREGKRLQREMVEHEKHRRRARLLQQKNGGGAKAISVNIGSQRRQDEKGKSSVAASYPRRVHTSGKLAAYLSDVEAEQSSVSASNDVESFLDELGDDDAAKTTATSTLPKASLPGIAGIENRVATDTTASKRDEEDFLDSIL